MPLIDLAQTPLRELNQSLHDLEPAPEQDAGDTGDIRDTGEAWTVINPNGAHAIAVGLIQNVQVTIDGHVGFYCAGMNQNAEVNINGHAGPGVAENMMSGVVRVQGNVSQWAGASGRGGLLVVEGNASSRCGISMKGIDIVVAGSVGHMSAFMAQAGRLVVCGDAGETLGDSLYEARLYVRGSVASLGADCVVKEMKAHHRDEVAELLSRARVDGNPRDFRRYGSARKLYHFNVDNAIRY